MTDPNTTLPPALRQALELLADPPTKADVSKGYLDLLGTGPVEDAAFAEERRFNPGVMGLASRDDALRQHKLLSEVRSNSIRGLEASPENEVVATGVRNRKAAAHGYPDWKLPVRTYNPPSS